MDDDLTSHWLRMEAIHRLPAWRSGNQSFFIDRFEGGTLREDWVGLDRLGHLQLLGSVSTGS